MKFTDYIKDEVSKVTTETKELKENMSQIGYTDVYEGSPVMGAHRHDYIIWDEFGYGYTSDALADPNAEVKYPVGGHIHHIINGKVWPAGDGHTHTLDLPHQIAPDVKIGDCRGCDCQSCPPKGIT